MISRLLGRPWPSNPIDYFIILFINALCNMHPGMPYQMMKYYTNSKRSQNNSKHNSAH